MKKLNKYQKLILILYGICFIYFSVIHVPFKVYGSDEIVYDTLFSERANLLTSRLILILIVISVAFAIFIFLINSLSFNLKIQPAQKRRLKPAMFIFVTVAIIAVTIFLLAKNKSLFSKTEKATADTTAITNASIDTTASIVEKAQPKPIYYKISNLKSYSNEHFQEFVSFTFRNISDETISNIMFKEGYFPVKKRKSDYTNKLITLQPKDSANFTFKKDHDELYVYKIRFSSGKTITFEADFFDFENMVYTKFGDNKD